MKISVEIKADLNVPTICKNGEKFYVVLNGKPTAIKLVDTYLSAKGDIKGHFKCADGREFYDATLGLCKDNTRGLTHYIGFSDEQNAINKVRTYATLGDLAEHKGIPYRGLYSIDVFCPFAHVIIRDAIFPKFLCKYYTIDIESGNTLYKETEYDKLVYAGGNWCFSEDGHTPIINFNETVFPNEKSALNYLRERLMESEVVDFGEDDEEGEDYVNEPYNDVIISILGQREWKEVVPLKGLKEFLKSVNANSIDLI